MKIQEVSLNRFKRFTDLKITNLPETAKLVVLVGPNGSGKTSLFEAFNHWHRLKGFNAMGPPQDYLEKNDGKAPDPGHWYQNKVAIKIFDNIDYDTQEQIKGKFYFRTAYRNEPDFTFSNLKKQNDPTQTIKLQTLMENDRAVSENYQRLVAQTLAGVFDSANGEKKVKILREELIGKIQTSLSAIFDDLNLKSIGDPLSNGSFYFEKGTSINFHYKNLSAGEKSVFDLVLDLIIKAHFYPDAIFCIDEPEAHMHTRLQSKVLRELYRLTPDTSQLWISSHSIGMLKEAEEIEERNPGAVVFLDFDNKNFDIEQEIRPTKISRAIWDRFLDIALADFSKLIAPQKIVFCEGTSKGGSCKNFDARVYGKIFSDKHHDTSFVSIGSASELENTENQSMNVVSSILKLSEKIKFIDRDDKSDEQVDALLKKGIKTSNRRHIESYMFDDEIIKKLCVSCGKENLIGECLQAKKEAIENSTSRGNPSDDIKSASGEIFTEIKKILELKRCGSDRCAFSIDTMSPLITEETTVFHELEREIFGTNTKPTTNTVTE